MNRRKSKKKAPSRRSSVENRHALTSVLTNPMILVLVITAGGVVLSAKFWSDFREGMRGEARFAVGPDQVQLTAQPDWIRSDFQRQALGGFDWQNRSLLDHQLVTDVGVHLENQLWVRQVQRVQKHPGGLTVDLDYRRPVGMVELSTNQLYPVDTEGVVLDSGEFSPNQTHHYLRLSIAGLPQSRPPLGQPWPDLRVVEASKIADALTRADCELGVMGVYGIRRPAGTQDAATEYRLWTARRNEIIWGHASGQETAGEAGVGQKIAALVDAIQRNGPIDDWSQLRLPEGNVLDLRSGKLVLLQSTAACVIPKRR